MSVRLVHLCHSVRVEVKEQFQRAGSLLKSYGSQESNSSCLSCVRCFYLLSHLTSLGFALLPKYYISHIYSSPQIIRDPLPWWFLNADGTEDAQARSGLGSFLAVSLRAWPFSEQLGMLISQNGPWSTYFGFSSGNFLPNIPQKPRCY